MTTDLAWSKLRMSANFDAGNYRPNSPAFAYGLLRKDYFPALQENPRANASEAT